MKLFLINVQAFYNKVMVKMTGFFLLFYCIYLPQYLTEGNFAMFDDDNTIIISEQNLEELVVKFKTVVD